MKNWFVYIVVIALSGAVAWAFLSSGDSVDAVFDGRGDTTTKAAVIEALNATPYEIRYRKVPRVEGYEMVAGRARSRAGGVIDFSVLLREAGQIEGDPQNQRSGSPQFPVVRYVEETGTTKGNANLVTQAQGRYVVDDLGHGEVGWLPTRREIEMSIELGIAIRQLFASNVDPGP